MRTSQFLPNVMFVCAYGCIDVFSIPKVYTIYDFETIPLEF
jgi:hypothetical protein